MKVQLQFILHAEMTEPEFGVMLASLAHYSWCENGGNEEDRRIAEKMNKALVDGYRDASADAA